MQIERGKSVKRYCVLWLLLAAICLMLNTTSQAAQLALLLQQSPADGGKVEPGVGVHRLDKDTYMTLRAVPKPGYQFVMWLGDVDEPTRRVTTAYMDAPKIIIAVFERLQYDSIAAAEMAAGGPGRTALRGSAADYSRTGGGGSVRRRRISPPTYPTIPEYEPPEEPQEEPEELLGPGDGLLGPDVPEPATLLTLGLGSLSILLRRKRK